MSYATLSELVEAAQPAATQVADLPLREAAALTAARTWGDRYPPEIINVGALAVSAAGRRSPHYLIRPSAVRLVHQTDLHTIPAEAPRMLRGPWLCEVRRPERGEWLLPPLVGLGATVSIGGYALDDRIYLVGLGYPDGACVASWRPQWTGADLDASIDLGPASLEGIDPGGYDAWCREAIRFALVLSLLLESDSAPIDVGERRGRKGKRDRARGGGGALAERHIYLDERRVRPPGESSGAAEGEPAEGRREETVEVRGHLKRQRYGEGRALTRWIYVAGYQARRWVAPGFARAVLHRKRGEDK